MNCTCASWFLVSGDGTPSLEDGWKSVKMGARLGASSSGVMVEHGLSCKT